ncbi:hypothetical protein CLOSTMETH_03616 [[Clostridium] methylpentosum DSM 5476]|uniref:Uncharacterized protein n=1 Tax=[Clostridium] methylpentosum DSM 5476 TaxID=537013 RepID=C0EIC0_9FIRM|nr:hypothetical protein CLOSTMETH_03616 [[Clostridium] methylpentosum DSM 5476]
MKNFCTCEDPSDLHDAIQLTQRDQKDCNRKPASLLRKVWITCSNRKDFSFRFTVTLNSLRRISRETTWFYFCCYATLF